MSDRAQALLVSARLSFRDYRVAYPWRLFALSTVPRAILQVAFFAWLGLYSGGPEGRAFAFVGAATHVVVLATVVKGQGVLVNERVFGTLYRLRLGALPLPLVVAARWWIYAVEGIVSFVVAALAVGPLVGETSLLPRMLAATPIVALVALTTSSLGMTVAALSLTHQRIELLAGNLVTYATLVLCGIVAPLATLGTPASRLVRLLPLTNGLLAVRAVVDGGDWAAHAAAEALVGAAWLAVGVAFLGFQGRRSRIAGSDDFV